MYKKTSLFRLRCITPLHPGAGATVLGVADLPIQREARTGWPKVEASSLRGALRYHVKEHAGEKKAEELFGPEPGVKELRPGAIGLSDARVILFPVRSTVGWFWITSRRAINELNELLKALGKEEMKFGAQADNGAVLAGDVDGDYVYIEEHKLKVQERNNRDLRSLGGLLDVDAERILLVPDGVFDFAVKTYTEIVPRIQIDTNTGTVKKGGFWYEERVPTETIFYFFVFGQDVHQKDEKGEDVSAEKAMNALADTLKEHPYFQLGGNRTLGEGIVQVKEVSLEEPER